MKDLFKSLPLAALLCVLSLAGAGSAQTPGATQGELKALEPYARETEIKEAFLKAFEANRNDVVRMTISRSLGEHIDDPRVLKAWVEALRTDRNDVVRMKTSRDLAAKVDLPEVYDLLLDRAKNDRNEVVRAHALSGLGAKIKSRPELRESIHRLSR